MAKAKIYMNPTLLKSWVNENDLLFTLTQREAEVLIEYLRAENNYLFSEGFKLKMYAEGYEHIVDMSIDNVVDLALDIHYNLVHCIEVKMRKATGPRYKAYKAQKAALEKDKRVLDGLFARTVYAKKRKGAFA